MRLSPVTPGTSVTLDDAAAHPAAFDEHEKEDLRERLAQLTRRLDELQSALYAEGSRALLVVLQGRDAAGKDGVIRNVFGPLDPQGLTLTAFKVPTPEERAHDYLWRIHKAVPPRGAIGIFNRSHYEDVLVVRVDRLVPEPEWRARYEQINAFERLLSDNGVTVLKFLLHVSREEQRERLRARLADPHKYWKFDDDDLRKRRQWDEYTAAYEEVLRRTSTAWAPWYVVPGDRKPVRDLLVAAVVLETLERMAPVYPGAPPHLEQYRADLST
jgi:PPK2 family polyphosphate:nucleotide phosphotransferase